MKPLQKLTAVVGLLALLLISGCGEKEETATTSESKPLTLMLDYLPNADHVGIYVALEKGYFKDAGLDLKIQTPPDPAAPLKLLAAGKTDLAISYEPELLLAREKGLKLVSVGAIVQKPLTSIISLGDKNIKKPSDLAGKTVGTAGIPYQSDYLKTVLKQANVDPKSVKEVNVGFNLVPAMLSDKVDATLGAFWNYEGVELAQAGKKPNIIRIEQAGVPSYDELIVVARKADTQKNGARVRRFLQALTRGYQATRKNPDSAVDALVKANPDLKRKLQLASVEATLPVFFPTSDSKPFGFQNDIEWARYGSWMYQQKLLKSEPIANRALTNEFLPGEAIRPKKGPN